MGKPVSGEAGKRACAPKRRYASERKASGSAWWLNQNKPGTWKVAACTDCQGWHVWNTDAERAS